MRGELSPEHLPRLSILFTENSKRAPDAGVACCPFQQVIGSEQARARRGRYSGPKSVRPARFLAADAEWR